MNFYVCHKGLWDDECECVECQENENEARWERANERFYETGNTSQYEYQKAYELKREIR